MRSVMSWSVLPLLLAASVAPAAAQGSARPERPYRGLFGSGTSETGQMLSVGASLGSGWDDDLEANARGTGGATTGRRAQSGTLTIPVVLTVSLPPVITAVTPSSLPVGSAATPIRSSMAWMV